MSFLLANSFFTEFWDSFYPRLKTTEIIVAMVLAVVGLTIAILARRITRAIKQKNDIPNEDKTLIVIKVIALLFMVASALLFIFTA